MGEEMFTALLILAALGYLNTGHVLTSRERAKNSKNNPDWHKFDKDWALSMLYLPVVKSGELVLSVSFSPALFAHRRLVERLEAQKSQDSDPDIQVGRLEAEIALEDGSFELPEPNEVCEQANDLNQVLVPKVLVPKEPSDK